MIENRTGCRWVLEGDVGGERRRFLLKEGLNRIGSLPASDVHLPAKVVSKRHAVLVVDPDRLLLEDLASKNGSYVGGRRVRTAAVRAGDRLSFGDVTLHLRETDPLDGRLAIVLEAAVAEASGPHETTTATSAGAEASAAPETSPLEPFFPEGYLPGKSEPMLGLYRQIGSVAGTDATVLIVGETGAGKEAVAQTLHAASPRRARPFVAINCAAIPANLLEAELFGIGKGVATEVVARPGRFRLADGGTLFLDEIGDMHLELQAKLLRVLEEKVVVPLGEAPAAVDVRLVAATHGDLPSRVASGGFRSDLYYRFAGMILRVPALRERRRDIPALVSHFLRRATTDARKPLTGMTALALERLVDHPWPGNVRELRHTVQRLVHLCPAYGSIDSSHVGAAVEMGTAFTAAPLPGQTAGAPQQELRATGGFDPSHLSDLSLATVERSLVREALHRAGGHRGRAAGLLGISRDALRRKIRKLGLES